MAPPPILETERLLLRPLRATDLHELALLHAEESFWWYPLRRGQTAEETRDFLATQIERYEVDPIGVSAAVDQASGRLVGWLGLSVPHFLPQVLPAVEVGWRLGRDWWGQGLAIEGAAAAMYHGFLVLGLERIVSVYEPDNVASGRVMDRLGLTLEQVTEHPRMGMALHVRSLTRARWEHQRAQGPWPARR